MDTSKNKLPLRKRARDDDDNGIKLKKRAKKGTLDAPMEVTPLETNQCVPQSEESCLARIQRKLEIQVEGVDVPPPLNTFREMKFPIVILQCLEMKGIVKPTPIQAHGIPTVLSSRDMFVIAPRGSGKTLVFILPLIMFCSNKGGAITHMQEGPYGLIICPTRKLAKKTFETIRYFTNYIKASLDWPEIRSCLLIDDVPTPKFLKIIKQGVNIMVATPVQLRNILDKKPKLFNLNSCKYLCMDEIERMKDMGFEKDLRRILTFFQGLKQTLIFSSTISKRTREFAASVLHQPVTIKYQMPLEIVQTIELMSEDIKLRYLLPCLAKTSPPALIFAQDPTDVDAIFQYLLSRGIQAAKNDCTQSIEDFRAGKKDVLVTTDALLEGLDFHNIQHVINYDMPDDLKDYVRRIQRTGGSGCSSGLATTFIAQAKTSVLQDLKDFLIQSQQNVPPLLVQFCS